MTYWSAGGMTYRVRPPEQRSYVSRLADLERAPLERSELCCATTLKGNPCSGRAQNQGLCVSHWSAFRRGAESSDGADGADEGLVGG